MPEFLKLSPPHEALDAFLSHLDYHPLPEWINTENALGRIAYTSINSPHPLPASSRSMVDGFAVRAADTFGASESQPSYFRIIGEVIMGTAPQYVVSQGECTTIHTGGMLPKGADAVVMVEHTQSVGSEDIEVYRSVGNRENVLSTGEEVGKGDEILPARKRLRPADIGSLMALGIMRIQVSCRPRVGIISSGDEVVSPDQTPEPGQVRDVNAYTLDAIVQEAGGIPKRYGIIPDDDVILENKARLALSENDIVVITAGSSASVRDLTSTVINRLGIPGVIVHGVNVRPGKPTILAVCQNKAVVGLPGNPVSAYVIAKLFVLPAIRQFLGVSIEDSALRIKAKLTVNLPSQAGREEWIPVRLKKVEISKQEVILADPIYAKSNFITNLVRADGFVRLHSDATGISANEEVEVYPI